MSNKDELLLTPQERLNAEDEALMWLRSQGKVVGKDGFERRDIAYTVREFVAQAQLTKAEPLIRKDEREKMEITPAPMDKQDEELFEEVKKIVDDAVNGSCVEGHYGLEKCPYPDDIKCGKCYMDLILAKARPIIEKELLSQEGVKASIDSIIKREVSEAKKQEREKILQMGWKAFLKELEKELDTKCFGKP